MSLGDRKPMRRCGTRYGTRYDAEHSKDVQQSGHEVVDGCPCGGFHTGKPARSAPRDTGPSRQVREMVYARDLECCAGCGAPVWGRAYSVQHRNARGMGGTSRPEANSLANLVLLCGDATTPGGCNLACEQRDPVMHERGLWLWSWESPDLVPVVYAVPGGLALCRLTGDGARVPVEGAA